MQNSSDTMRAARRTRREGAIARARHRSATSHWRQQASSRRRQLDSTRAAATTLLLVVLMPFVATTTPTAQAPNVIANNQATSMLINKATQQADLHHGANGSRAKRHSGAEQSPADELALRFAASPAPCSSPPQQQQQQQGGSNKYRTLYACEEKQLQIECQLGESIQVIRANYGRFSVSLCNDHGQVDLKVNCMSPASTSIIANSCQGRQSCQLLASNNIFGDPCRGTFKYLEVHYQCVCSASTATNRTSTPQEHLLEEKLPRQPNVIPPTSADSASEVHGAPTPASERHRQAHWSPAQLPMSLPPLAPPSGPTPLPSWVPSELSGASRAQPSAGAAPAQRPRCPEMVWRQMRWPATDAGQVAQQPCPAHAPALAAPSDISAAASSSAGPLLLCQQSAAWAPHLLSTPACHSLGLRILAQRLESGDSPLAALAELTRLTATTNWPPGADDQSAGARPTVQQANGLFGDDIVLINRLVRRLVDEMGEMLNRIGDDKQRLVFAREMVQLLAELVNNLAHEQQVDAWMDLAHAERQRTAGQLAQSLERAAVLLAGSQVQQPQSQSQQQAESFLRANDNVYLAIRTLPPSANTSAVQVSFPSELSTLGTRWMSAEQRFTLHLQTSAAAPAPSEQQAQVDVKYSSADEQASSALKVVFVMLRGLGAQMEPIAPESQTTMASATMDEARDARLVVDSNLVSMSIVADARYKHAPVKVDLSAPVELVFQHLRARAPSASPPSGVAPRCAYWDTNHSEWLTDGCKLVATNKTHSTCACNHLTSFALLADSSAVDAEQPLAVFSAAEQQAAMGGRAGGVGSGSGQNQHPAAAIELQHQLAKVQLDSVDNELILPTKALYLAKMLDGLLFAGDSLPAQTATPRLLLYVSCLLSASLLALVLAAAAYNQSQARRLLGAMPQQPPPPLLVANHHQHQPSGGVVRGGSSTNSDVSPTYSTSDYSAALATTKSKLERARDFDLPGAGTGSRQQVAKIRQLQLPAHLALQLLALQLLLVMLLESQNYLQRNSSPARSASLSYPFFNQPPQQLQPQTGSGEAPVGALTWLLVGSLYYLVAAFTCWLARQLIQLNLALWRLATHRPPAYTGASSHPQRPFSSATESTSSSAKSSGGHPPATIYGRAPATTGSLYGTAASVYGGQHLQQARASPSSSFSSDQHPHSHQHQAPVAAHRQLARLEDSARFYAGAGQSRPSGALVRLLTERMSASARLVEHGLPLALVALVGWMSAPGARLLNALAYTADLAHQLAYWPLLVDASIAPLALVLYYAPAACVGLGVLALVRVRRSRGRATDSARRVNGLTASIVNPYGSSTMVGGHRHSALEQHLAATQRTEQEAALNKQSMCRGDEPSANYRFSYPASDANRAKFLCGWLLALLALHSTCWISFFNHVHRALNSPGTSQAAASNNLIYTAAAANLLLVILLTWLQRRSLRRAASLAGLGQALGRCCLCLCGSSRGTRARIYRAATQQAAAAGSSAKASASSQSLFLAAQHQQQQQQAAAAAAAAANNGAYLYSAGYPSGSQQQQQQQHLYHQLSQQPAHIYDSASNTLGDHRLHMIQMMQQQQQQQQQQRHQQQLHQMHQFDQQQQQHTYALNRSLSSLQHAHQMEGEQRQPMTLKPTVNSILPLMFNQQSRNSDTTPQHPASSGQPLLVLDAAEALKQQQQQFAACHQPASHLAGGAKASEQVARPNMFTAPRNPLQQQQQQSGEADGPLVALSSHASGQPATTFGPTSGQLTSPTITSANSSSLHQHQLSGRQLFSGQQTAARQQLAEQQQQSSSSPINCISGRAGEHLARAAGCPVSVADANQHQYCAIGTAAAEEPRGYTSALKSAMQQQTEASSQQQQQPHFRRASGKLQQSAMIDRAAMGGGGNIYDVANYALGNQ